MYRDILQRELKVDKIEYILYSTLSNLVIGGSYTMRYLWERIGTDSENDFTHERVNATVSTNHVQGSPITRFTCHISVIFKDGERLYFQKFYGAEP